MGATILLTNFRKTFFKYCDAYIRRMVNLWPPKLGASEKIYRGLTSDKDFDKKTGRIKNARRFGPVLDVVLNVHETSVVYAPKFGLNDLVNHIQTKVLGNGTANLHGIGQLSIQDVLDCALTARRDRIPRLHAAIVGWPVTKRQLEKEKMLESAQDLANRAKLVWTGANGVPLQPFS